ncbi:hypothetical protein BDN67DRAFT_366234 [Paxillus ammoniavirescens]|nr:hypothetical protein BDN67DRAFT_366234 [Paxillus ammoniavirescens]
MLMNISGIPLGRVLPTHLSLMMMSAERRAASPTLWCEQWRGSMEEFLSQVALVRPWKAQPRYSKVFLQCRSCVRDSRRCNRLDRPKSRTKTDHMFKLTS